MRVLARSQPYVYLSLSRSGKAALAPAQSLANLACCLDRSFLAGPGSSDCKDEGQRRGIEVKSSGEGQTAFQILYLSVLSKARSAANRPCTEKALGSFERMALGTVSMLRRQAVGTSRIISSGYCMHQLCVFVAHCVRTVCILGINIERTSDVRGYRGKTNLDSMGCDNADAAAWQALRDHAAKLNAMLLGPPEERFHRLHCDV